MRVYLPLLWSELAELAAVGWQGPRRDVAVPEFDDEEAEYDALCDAAEVSHDLLLEARTRPRRAVAAIDVTAADLEIVGGKTYLISAVPLARIGSVLVDSEDAEDDVKSGASGVDHELEWWATQEIHGLLN